MIRQCESSILFVTPRERCPNEATVIMRVEGDQISKEYCAGCARTLRGVQEKCFPEYQATITIIDKEKKNGAG